MTVKELDGSPNLLRLYALAAATTWAGRGGLPDTELVLRDAAIDRDHLAAYTRVCGFRLREHLPVTYPHILAFPLAIELMAQPSFPFALPGLVHIENRITQHRPIGTEELLTVRVRTEELRDHPKGRQFDVVATVLVGDEEVWDETSTYLRRGDGSGEGKQGDRWEPPETSARWRVSGDTGRRYAGVSGDRNPIHLHPVTARLFGFPRPIAHGMWTKARCLAAFEGRLPESFTTEASFRKPLLLPSTVAFGSEETADGWRFALTGKDGERLHLRGTITA